MKWKNTIAAALLLTVTTGAFAQEDDIWQLGNLTVLAFPAKDVEVSRTVEDSAVQLKFNHWSPTVESELRRSLLKSPLSYRLFPSRQATMTVEIFSPTSNVAFSAKQQKGSIQILVGESSTGRAAVNLLMTTETGSPMDGETLKALKDGALGKARSLILKDAKKKTEDEQFLARARAGIVDVGLRGSRAGSCPLPPEKIITPIDLEASYLAAWCMRATKRPSEALTHLAAIERSGSTGPLMERSEKLKSTVVYGLIMNADRRGEPLAVGREFLERRDIIVDRPVGATLLEVISDNLNRIGLGSLLAKVADRIVSGSDENRLRNLAGIISETYYNSGQFVRAADAASYFLSKRQPSWLSGRLYRIRGRVRLQEGNWSGAAADLSRARPLLLDWSIEDEISLAEAMARKGTPLEEIKTTTDGSRGGYSGLSSGFEGWFTRVWGESELIMGRLPKPEALDSMPAHVLYNAAQKASARGEEAVAVELLRRAKKGKGGWSRLAKQSDDIAKMNKEMAMYRAIAEMER